MTTQEIYKLASELTEKQVLNIVAGWENAKETKTIETYNTLVRLGDSMQLACASAISEKYNDKGVSGIYKTAYES
jgi:hypothetical protein